MVHVPGAADEVELVRTFTLEVVDVVATMELDFVVELVDLEVELGEVVTFEVELKVVAAAFDVVIEREVCEDEAAELLEEPEPHMN